jgi:hypothetical protein
MEAEYHVEADDGRLALIMEKPQRNVRQTGAAEHGLQPCTDYSAGQGCPCSRCGIVQGRPEPVKAVCARRTTAPGELVGERTREDDLD